LGSIIKDFHSQATPPAEYIRKTLEDIPSRRPVTKTSPKTRAPKNRGKFNYERINEGEHPVTF
jgi:hypothetical protein